MKKQRERYGIIGNIEIKKPQYKVGYILILLFAIFMAAICIVPPLWVILSSLKTQEEFYRVPPTIIPQTFDFRKIIELWKTFNFGKYYLNTVCMALGCIAFSITSNGLAGYALSKLKGKGVKVMFTIVMATLMMPTGSTGMVPIYKNILNVPLLNINLINTFWPMWLMSAANAFYIVVYKSFFDGIPDSVLESARIDGCSEVGSFFRIALPLSKPIMFTMVILVMNGAWSLFFWPFLVLRNKDLYTVTVEMFMIQPYVTNDKLVGLLTFSIVPPVVFFLIFQKYIMQGFTASGIKG